jgi:lipoprotein-releasing system permease protein
MPYPLGLYIGLRYLRAKRRNRFISFISLVSMLGIALGVAVLITVLSVMNGFDEQIQTRIFSMASHITLLRAGGISDWPALRERVLSQPGVTGAAPQVSGQGILTHSGVVHSTLVQGVLPALEARVSELGQHMMMGQLSDLRPGEFGIVLGEKLATQLGVYLGDKVVLVTPKAAVTLLGILPTFKRFTVVGIFSVGNGFAFDSHYAFIHLQDAQKLYSMGDKISSLRIQAQQLSQAPSLARQLQQQLGAMYQANDWTGQYGGVFAAVSMEKTMMFLVLCLIVVVAVFNLISSLVMVVTDKQADIAILRTLGATPGKIMRVFVTQGSMIGAVGTILGLLLGVTLAWNVTGLVHVIETLFNVHLFTGESYYVDYLPSKLLGSDVIKICSLSLLLSVLATLYPAWQAAQVRPAEALRYE